MSDLIKKAGFDFAFDSKACSDCGSKCCVGKQGYIWVSSKEIEEIAKYLDADVETFIKDYLKKDRYRYSIKDVLVDGSWECLFFDKRVGCQIYEARPKQCRTYPFWDFVQQNIEQERLECPGIV